MVEDALADAQALGRNLEQLVVREELQALLQAQLARRHETQRVVRAGGAGVGQLLFLADVTVMSSCFGDTPTTMPAYTGTPAPMNSWPRSCALNKP